MCWTPYLRKCYFSNESRKSYFTHFPTLVLKRCSYWKLIPADEHRTILTKSTQLFSTVLLGVVCEYIYLYTPRAPALPADRELCRWAPCRRGGCSSRDGAGTGWELPSKPFPGIWTSQRQQLWDEPLPGSLGAFAGTH